MPTRTPPSRLPRILFAIGSLLALREGTTPRSLPAADAVDVSPLPLKVEIAFPDLKWSGWEPVDAQGKPAPLRPIVLTHAGDGSKRIFVATQQGVVHVFPDSDAPRSTKIFLDLQKKVTYKDKENEEGFLGMAFHPRYRTDGRVFVHYTTSDAPHVSVVSSFRVSADDPDRADPASEVEILRIPQPYWNHNGGSIEFGPDGRLYVSLGDGGSKDDPLKNGQNLKTLLGKILRIDVDRQDPGLKYAVPKDNPFAGQPDEARGEIWAYGLRNVWRMSFDRKTGTLWAADVGQDLWEEIDLIVKGGNYGWNLREGLHKFKDGADPRPDLIEPIWEYDHVVGKSITGGYVYRGTKLPALAGLYVYADYVSGKLWGLRYDEGTKRVVGNHPIPSEKLPVLSFGETEDGEIHFLLVAPNGQGLRRFAAAGK